MQAKACNFIQKGLWRRCFPVNFANCKRTPFFYRTPADDCFWPLGTQKVKGNVVPGRIRIGQARKGSFWLSTVTLTKLSSWISQKFLMEKVPRERYIWWPIKNNGDDYAPPGFSHIKWFQSSYEDTKHGKFVQIYFKDTIPASIRAVRYLC